MNAGANPDLLLACSMCPAAATLEDETTQMKALVPPNVDDKVELFVDELFYLREPTLAPGTS